MIKNKVQLALRLSELKQLKPKEKLDQFATPSEIAASLAWIAFQRNELKGKICDLGCGNGILAIACSLLSECKCFGYDIDKAAIKIAKENAKTVNAKCEFFEKDFREIQGSFDVVIMNPPFGSWPFRWDREFLEKAFTLADKVYSIHPFHMKEILQYMTNKHGFKLCMLERVAFPLKKSFWWHKKKIKRFEAGIFRFEKAR